MLWSFDQKKYFTKLIHFIFNELNFHGNLNFKETIFDAENLISGLLNIVILWEDKFKQYHLIL